MRRTRVSGSLLPTLSVCLHVPRQPSCEETLLTTIETKSSKYGGSFVETPCGTLLRNRHPPIILRHVLMVLRRRIAEMSESLRGNCLVACSKLRDPNFFKTAVLLIEHGDDGAMGLVVNRPSSVTVSNALAGQFDLPETGDLVYFGGPVEPTAMFILHSAADFDPDEPAIVPGLHVASSIDVFSEVLEASCHGCDTSYRAFFGCAGWAPLQLEGELANGDWFVVPARADLVFHRDPYAVWDFLLTEAYRSKRLLSVDCDHPEWN